MPDRHYRALSMAACLIGLLSACTTMKEPAASPEITLTKTVHFVGAEGNDLVVAPGTYAVAAGNGPRIELISSFGIVADNRVLDAVSTNVGQTLASPVALYVPWENDEHHIILVQPSGDGLEAVGTGRAVRERGIVSRPLPPDAIKKALADYHAQILPRKP